MSATNMLDDYLGELLLDAVPPPPPAAKVVELVQPVATPEPAAAPDTPQAEAAPAAAIDLPAMAEPPVAETPPESPVVAEQTPLAAAAPPPAPVMAPVAVPPAPAPAMDPPVAKVAAVSPPPAPAPIARTPAIRQVPAAAPRPAPAAPAAPAVSKPAGNNVWAALQAQAREPGEPQHRRATERASRWLRLRCGKQTYALELLKVQEVVLPVPLLGLRGTGPSMLGIMNLRGQVVPVIDLGLHLGFEAVVEDGQTRIVVLEENGDTLGLRVSAVEDVASLTDSQIEPPDTARICQISNTLFRGVARIGPQPMILLDALQLLHGDR